MQILIVGCGKVGGNLAAQLSQEDHNVTVVDTNPDVVRQLSISYDLLGITGNGTDFEVLKSADLENTDILIAVTNSDEVNLLCCVLAKRLSNCRTIARVRNPIYSSGRDYIQRALDLSMTINPEEATAREIARILRFPTVKGIQTFAKGKIDMYQFRVSDNSSLIGVPLKDSSHEGVLICIAERGHKIYIPNGDFVPEKGDVLSIISGPGRAYDFFRSIGIQTHSVRNTMIVGCGQMSYYLAQILLRMGIRVKIIERDYARCEELSAKLPKAAIINGDGSDENLLREERLSDMDSFVASTGIDEENIILSLYAQSQVKTKVVTKISHLEFNDVIRSLDLDSIYNPKKITSEYILQYVRAMGSSVGSNVETLYRLMDDRVEALEFKIMSDRFSDKTLEEMHFKPDTLVAGVYRKNKFILPDGNETFIPGDSVFVVTTKHGFRDLSDVFIH